MSSLLTAGSTRWTETCSVLGRTGVVCATVLLSLLAAPLASGVDAYVVFDPASHTAIEGGGSYPLKVKLEDGSRNAVTFPHVVSVTLTPHVTPDYSINLTDGKLDIPANQSEVVVDVSITNDALDEEDEHFPIGLSDPVGADLDVTAEHTLTIFDEDPEPTVRFEDATRWVYENALTYNIVVELSAASSKDITVNYEVGGTAVVGDQYTIDASPLTINAGSDTGLITVSLADDGLWEPDVDVVVTMLSAVNATIVAPSMHTLTIRDDEDHSEFSFDHSDPDGDDVIVVSRREDDPPPLLPTYTARIRLSPPSSQTEQVRVVVSGTATGTDLEDELLTQTLVFDPEEPAQEITFTAKNDSLYENDETVILTLQKLTGANVGDIDTFKAIIENTDDAPAVTFTASPLTFPENGGPLEINVTLNAEAGVDIELPFTTSGIAESGTDYTIGASPFIVPEGDETATLEITPVQDGSDEENEGFTVTFETPPVAVPQGDQVFNFTITDIDDPPDVSFRVDAMSASEGTTARVYVDVTPPSGKIVTVPFANVGGTAIEDVHYYAPLPASPLTIVPGESAGYIDVELLDDLKDEDAVTLELELQTPIGNGNLVAPTTHTLTIEDDDPAPQISFTPTSRTETEADATYDVTVQLDRESEFTVTVDLDCSGNATEGDAADYTKSTDSLTFNPGEISKVFQITVKQDDLYELDEEIIVNLTNPQNAQLGTDATHTHTIEDNDTAPTVEFETETRTVQEDDADPRLYVRVELSERAGRDILVPFTVAGSATDTEDFTISASPHVIPEGNLGASIIIDLINDDSDEDEENILLTLLDPPDDTQLGTKITHTVTLQDDDDPPTIQFSAASQRVDEDAGTIPVTVTVTPPSGKQITAPFTVNVASSAIDPDDYELSPADQLVIPPGTASADIQVTVKTDVLDEEDETVVLDLGTPQEASLGTPATHTVTIGDVTDVPEVHFTTNAQTDAEDVGTFTIQLNLTAVSAKDVTVPLALSGTAAEVTDYTLGENPVVIPAGQLTHDLTVTIVDDDMDENEETVVLTMNSPTNATLSTAEPVEHTLTIEDNDGVPTVAFTTEYLEINEDVGQVRVTAQLSITSGKEVTVPLTFGGSAVKDEDYTVGAESIVIPPDAGSADLVVTVIDDDIKEEAETVISTMGTPTNATLDPGVDAFLEHTLNILDNEPDPQFTIDIAFAGEGTGIVSQVPGGTAYVIGTVVTLTATPENGSEFTGWSGDLTGSANPTTVVMDGNKSITATFGIDSPDMYTLQVSTAGTGAGNVSLSPPGGTFQEGTVVTLTATSATGSVFDGFSGDVTANTSPASVVMNSAKSVTATFTATSGGNPNPNPGGDPQSFSLTKGLIKLNFKADGKDQITIQGQLPTPAGFVAENQQVNVTVAGVSRSFTLDAKGKAKVDNDRFMVKIKKKKGEVLEQASKFKALFRKGSFKTELAAVGAVNEDLKDEPIVVPIRITYNGALYGVDQSFTYKSKKDKTGTAKAP